MRRQIKVSLICATLGRVLEVKALIDSLKQQTLKDFELIIVDQNDHDLIKDIIDTSNADFDIVYIKNDTAGLSLNRNIGLQYAKGDILGYPDDDCFYSPDVLSNVVDILQDATYGFVAVHTKDSITCTSRRISQTKQIHKQDIFKNCISYNIFVRKNNLTFDESLGVGTYFSSGEEIDYLYEYISKDKRPGYFDVNSTIYHPDVKKDLNKVYKYSLGYGALQKKDLFKRGDSEAILRLLYYSLRAIIGIATFCRVQEHYLSLKGKIEGFIKFHV